MSSFDLGIREIYYKYENDPHSEYKVLKNRTKLPVGEEIRFKVEVKNYEELREPEYRVRVYDEDFEPLGKSGIETPAKENKTNNAYINVTVDKPDKQDIRFLIDPVESGWYDSDEDDNEVTVECEWVGGSNKKKIFIRFGHEKLENGSRTGAVGILAEMDVIKEYASELEEILEDRGYDVKVFKPYYGNYKTRGDALRAGTDKANDWGADLFVSCHANNLNSSSKGTEVCYKRSDCKSLARSLATEISDALGTTIRRDRGAYYRAGKDGLHELNAADMPAVILEPFFLSNQGDCDKYQDCGPRKLARAIADGIDEYFE